MRPAESRRSRPGSSAPGDTTLPPDGLPKDRTSAPTFAEVWQILNDEDRAQLAGIEVTQDEILTFLHTQPEDDTPARLFSELQVERLHIYRTTLDRKQGEKSPANP